MRVQAVPRPAAAFQAPVTAEQIERICGRVFGASASEAVELGNGMYNTTYRVRVAGRAEPVILRVAPEPGRQFRSERELMRNEYASLPWLAGLAPLMPAVLAADWSHELIGRDYLVQTLLPGVPAPDRLGDYPRSSWPGFFRQLGEITARVHAVRGPYFGPVSGPGYPVWSQAVAVSLDEIAADMRACGLDATDVHDAAEAARGPLRPVLDEVSEPRLLAGDLWTVNVMLADAPQPTISGVFDLDRTWWGDPAADWGIRMAGAKPGTERDAFWDGYGPRDLSPVAAVRAAVYEVRHLGAVRLERHRLGNTEQVAASYEQMRSALLQLAAAAGRAGLAAVAKQALWR